MRRPALVMVAAAVIPMAILAVVVMLTPWVPVLDMAMTELRVRDVGTGNTPLIGLPGRIGNFPEQGSHAGPWYFYIVAVIYRLSGSRPQGMELASVLLNIGAIGTAVWLSGRRFGWRGVAAMALISVFLVRYYASVVLAQPWNPYFPVLIWALAVFAAVLVIMGQRNLTPLVVITASIAAQTHVPYLTPAVALCGGLLAFLLWKRDTWTPIIAGLVAAGVMWLPPIVDQLLRRPGNLKMMFDHFTGEHDEPAIGVFGAAKVVSQHLDIIGAAVDLFTTRTPAIERASDIGSFSIVGIVVLIGWIGTAIWVVRRRERRLYALYAVTGLLLVVDWLSISRIFGKVWFYLTLWMPITALLVWSGIAATALLATRDRRPPLLSRRRPLAALATLLVGSLTLISTVDVVRYQAPEERQGAPVGALMPSIVDALPNDGERYLVYWQEAVFSGSQGLALFNELDRRSYDVGVPDTWRVPATTHRVLTTEQATAELHLVSGVFIERTAQRPGFELIAEADVRSDAERERFDDLSESVSRQLVELGRDDLVPGVEESIFKLSLDDELPPEIIDELDEMIEIGVPVAVFRAAPGAGLGTSEFP